MRFIYNIRICVHTQYKGHPKLDTEQESGSPTTPRRHHQVTAAGTSEGLREEGWGPTQSTAPEGQTPYTLSVKVPRGPRGFGFSVTWSRPPRVERVDAGLPAAAAGLLPGDYIIFVGARNIVRLDEKGVMAAIKECGNELSLEVYRKGTTLGPPSLASRRSLFQPPSGPIPLQQSLGPVPPVHQVAPSGPGSGRRRWQSTEDAEKNSNNSYYNCLLYKHSQIYPAILSSPSRHHGRFQQVTRPYLSAVVQEQQNVDWTSSGSKPGSCSIPSTSGRGEAILSACRHQQHPARRKLLLCEKAFAREARRGIERYVISLTFRRDLLTEHQHQHLFSEVEELVTATERLVDRLAEVTGTTAGAADTGGGGAGTADGTENFKRAVGTAYLPLLDQLLCLYEAQLRRTPHADQILASKLCQDSFRQFVAQTNISDSCLDITAFLHLPAQHVREVLGALQELQATLPSPAHDPLLDAVTLAYRNAYRDVTSEHNIMEPGLNASPHSPARLRSPLICVADIAARLVFTRFTEPFTLDDGRRRWVFGGELWVTEGRQTRHYWAMLFSDLLLLTVINRDRVIYVVEEPLLLSAIVQTNFNVKKRVTELRLMLDTGVRLGSTEQESYTSLQTPVQRVWNRLTRTRIRTRTRTLVLRAPSPEHKATWSNLLQRCIASSKRGSASSPTDEPALFHDLHFGLDRAVSVDALHLLRSTPPTSRGVFK
ncbi:PDZ domain, partial [Trinorchestia longiramus]